MRRVRLSIAAAHRPAGEVGWLGPEHPAKSSGNTHGPDEGGAESGALSGDSGPGEPSGRPVNDPELAAVVAAWPDLPPAIRAGIVATVKAIAKDSSA